MKPRARFRSEVGLEKPKQRHDIKVSVGFALFIITGMGLMCFLPGVLAGTSLEVFGMVYTLGVILIVVLLKNARFVSRLHIELVAVSCTVVFLLLFVLHQYVHYFIWDQQCAHGDSEACWQLAKTHRAERDIGMRKSKAAFYEDRACKLQHPIACQWVLERGDNEPSLAPKR